MKRDLDWIIDNRLTQRKFNKLSKEKQRVYIARDVLAQMQAGQLRAEEGCYLSNDAIADALLNERDQTRDFGVLISRKPCTACAIGSLFACAVKIADQAPAAGFLKDATNSGRMNGMPLKSYLDRFFPREQQALIEAAFEGVDISSQCAIAGVDAGTITAARSYNDGVAGGRMRMTRIMRNIIRNDGDFDPNDRTVAAR